MQKTWFITGASSGFGLSILKILLARGNKVAATARNLESLRQIKEQYPDNLWIMELDIKDSQIVHNVVNDAFSHFKTIDVVVNNAGYGLFGAAEETTNEQIERIIDTNLMGSIRVIRAFLPHLRKQNRGRILQVSSEGGQVAYPNFSAYHASKWGIEGFVESTAQEVSSFNIEFTIVEPGPTRTSFGKSLDTAEPIEEYKTTASGKMRESFSNGIFTPKGDLEKMANAIIDSVDVTPAPFRLALGSTAFENINNALNERLAALHAMKSITLNVDIDA